MLAFLHLAIPSGGDIADGLSAMKKITERLRTVIVKSNIDS